MTVLDIVGKILRIICDLLTFIWQIDCFFSMTITLDKQFYSRMSRMAAVCLTVVMLLYVFLVSVA